MITFSKEMLMIEPEYTLTVVTTPSNASCTLNCDGITYSAKSLTVKKGSTISYSITYSPYGTTTGNIVMESDKVLTCTGVSNPSYTDVSWTNPYLTANGTLGESAFAVQADRERSGYNAYKAFDGNLSGNAWIQGTTNVTSSYMIMYNPTAIKLSTLDITNNHIAANHTPDSGTVYGSDNGTSWTSICDYTNAVVGVSENWTINVNSASYYKYHKLLMNMPKSQIPSLTEIEMNGYYQSETTVYSWEISIA